MGGHEAAPQLSAKWMRGSNAFERCSRSKADGRTDWPRSPGPASSASGAGCRARWYRATAPGRRPSRRRSAEEPQRVPTSCRRSGPGCRSDRCVVDIDPEGQRGRRRPPGRGRARPASSSASSRSSASASASPRRALPAGSSTASSPGSTRSRAASRRRRGRSRAAAPVMSAQPDHGGHVGDRRPRPGVATQPDHQQGHHQQPSQGQRHGLGRRRQERAGHERDHGRRPAMQPQLGAAAAAPAWWPCRSRRRQLGRARPWPSRSRRRRRRKGRKAMTSSRPTVPADGRDPEERQQQAAEQCVQRLTPAASHGRDRRQRVGQAADQTRQQQACGGRREQAGQGRGADACSGHATASAKPRRSGVRAAMPLASSAPLPPEKGVRAVSRSVAGSAASLARWTAAGRRQQQHQRGQHRHDFGAQRRIAPQTRAGCRWRRPTTISASCVGRVMATSARSAAHRRATERSAGTVATAGAVGVIGRPRSGRLRRE